MYVCSCLCAWGPEINVRTLPLTLPTLFIKAGSLNCPELSDMASLSSQLAPGGHHYLLRVRLKYGMSQPLTFAWFWGYDLWSTCL